MSGYLLTQSGAPHPDRLVQEMGRQIGSGLAKASRAALGPDPLRAGQEAFWRTISTVLASRHWGNLHYVERAGRVGLIEVRDWAATPPDGARWLLTVGLLEGLLSDLVGRPIAVEDLGGVDGEPGSRRFGFGPEAAVRQARRRDRAAMERASEPGRS
jgi:hypothetical protein